MRDFRDAKAMAQTLREALKTKSVSLTHSESLELIAKVLGFHDWNVLSARIQAEPQPPAAPIALRPAIDLGGRLPIMPVRDIVLFPQMMVPLFVGREATQRAIEQAMATDKRILMVTQKRAADDNPGADALYGVGATGSLLDVTVLPDTTVKVMVKCLARVAITHLAAESSFLAGEIAAITETRGEEEEALRLARVVLEKFQAYRNASLAAPPYRQLPLIQKPGELADAVAPFLLVKIEQRQDLLATGDVITRLEKILTLMQTDQQAA
jgi:uncharacterized protein